MDGRRDEKGKTFTKKVSKDEIEVIIQTVTNRIQGCLHIRPDQRIKDGLDDASQFLAVTQGKVTSNQGEELYSFEFLAVSRDHVVWVKPEEDREPEERAGGWI